LKKLDKMEKEVLIEKHIEKSIYYVYVYLDPRKPGKYVYGDYSFDYEPFYVGKGSGSRKGTHLWENKNNTTNQYKFNKIQKIIREIGEKPIVLTYKENLINSEAYLLEDDIIEKIGITKEGGVLVNVIKDNVNRNKDRDYSKSNNNSIKRIQYDLDGNFIKEWESAKQVERILGICNSNIVNVCNGKRKSAGGFIWKNKNESDKFIRNISLEGQSHIKKLYSKPILQYSIEGFLIKEWESINDAEIEMDVKNISRAIKKQYLSAGYIWTFKQSNTNNNLPEELLMNILSNSHKLILQYSINGELIQVHSSAKDTMNEFGISTTHFYRICNKGGVFKNYRWFRHRGGVIKQNIN
jgi:hypothetical protein